MSHSENRCFWNGRQEPRGARQIGDRSSEGSHQSCEPYRSAASTVQNSVRELTVWQKYQW